MAIEEKETYVLEGARGIADGRSCGRLRLGHVDQSLAMRRRDHRRTTTKS